MWGDSALWTPWTKRWQRAVGMDVSTTRTICVQASAQTIYFHVITQHVGRTTDMSLLVVSQERPGGGGGRGYSNSVLECDDRMIVNEMYDRVFCTSQDAQNPGVWVAAAPSHGRLF